MEGMESINGKMVKLFISDRLNQKKFRFNIFLVIKEIYGLKL